jgi:hypothetical protein
MRFKHSGHALTRYIERVKPAMTRSQAMDDLERMIEYGQIVERPDWIEMSEELAAEREGTRYFELIDGIVLVLSPEDKIVTVCVRGVLDSSHRQARNANKRQRKRARERERAMQSPRRPQRPMENYE